MNAQSTFSYSEYLNRALIAVFKAVQPQDKKEVLQAVRQADYAHLITDLDLTKRLTTEQYGTLNAQKRANYNLKIKLGNECLLVPVNIKS
jgi:hypothetical protein